MKTREAIWRIEDHVEVHGIGSGRHIMIGIAIEAAIAALREKAARENQEPLTVEQLREMEYEPIWIVDVGRVEWGNQWCVFDGSQAAIPGVGHYWYHIDNYGETWLAYASKPEVGT